MGLVAVDFTVRWKSPVYVGDGPLLTKTISGPADALRHMKNLTHRSGPIYWRAFDLCQHALTNGVHPEISRSHFIAACADADARRLEED
ncbi:DUF982 domain-containing protein [Rhizobium panacihumi]|uniref:DUF982 domain-containing protein n=1 Tax=Rhizobium panacihumi TaxID=2008450 RepID=UPI003D7ABDF8